MYKSDNICQDVLKFILKKSFRQQPSNLNTYTPTLARVRAGEKKMKEKWLNHNWIERKFLLPQTSTCGNFSLTLPHVCQCKLYFLPSDLSGKILFSYLHVAQEEKRECSCRSLNALQIDNWVNVSREIKLELT